MLYESAVAITNPSTHSDTALLKAKIHDPYEDGYLELASAVPMIVSVLNHNFFFHRRFALPAAETTTPTSLYSRDQAKWAMFTGLVKIAATVRNGIQKRGLVKVNFFDRGKPAAKTWL